MFNDDRDTKLPLEPFDDNEFETRSPIDWINLAKDENNKIKGIPCKYLNVDKETKIGSFLIGTVIDYDADKE